VFIGFFLQKNSSLDSRREVERLMDDDDDGRDDDDDRMVQSEEVEGLFTQKNPRTLPKKNPKKFPKNPPKIQQFLARKYPIFHITGNAIDGYFCYRAVCQNPENHENPKKKSEKTRKICKNL
jgi:hypothetical protein